MYRTEKYIYMTEDGFVVNLDDTVLMKEYVRSNYAPLSLDDLLDLISGLSEKIKRTPQNIEILLKEKYAAEFLISMHYSN